MNDQDLLAARFETYRPHLRGVGYRMLGSVSEAEDAVQEAWIRLSRSDAGQIEDLRAWLTTVVSRVCLNLLRSRGTRHETPLETHLPDPVVTPADPGADPERDALLGEAAGMALLVVLDTLTPEERTAFVLHDVFGMPFDQVARVLDRSPTAVRQLASRGRRRVRGAPVPEAALAEQWTVVEAFIAAARDGDLERLLAVLHPDVVVRADGGPSRPSLNAVTRGAEAVASQALMFRQFAASATRVLVNGVPGGIARRPDGIPFALLALTVREGRIAEIDVLMDPDRLATVDADLLRG